MNSKSSKKSKRKVKQENYKRAIGTRNPPVKTKDDPMDLTDEEPAPVEMLKKAKEAVSTVSALGVNDQVETQNESVNILQLASSQAYCIDQVAKDIESQIDGFANKSADIQAVVVLPGPSAVHEDSGLDSEDDDEGSKEPDAPASSMELEADDEKSAGNDDSGSRENVRKRNSSISSSSSSSSSSSNSESSSRSSSSSSDTDSNYSDKNKELYLSQQYGRMCKCIGITILLFGFASVAGSFMTEMFLELA